MIKHIWDLGPEDIAVIDGEKYQWKRDFKRRMPRLGMMYHRQLVNIETGQCKLFVRGFDVEVMEPKPETTGKGAGKWPCT